jgi:hypothetical protein
MDRFFDIGRVAHLIPTFSSIVVQEKRVGLIDW